MSEIASQRCSKKLTIMIAVLSQPIWPIILLHEKFQQFDWLRAVVFQLNLKYLHVKITVSMVTKITKQIKKQWRKDFQILKWKRFKNLRKLQKTQTRRKEHQPGLMSGPAGPKARILKLICFLMKQNNQNTRHKINRWRYKKFLM